MGAVLGGVEELAADFVKSGDGGADGGGGGTLSNALKQVDSRIKSCDTSLTSISTTSYPAFAS
jgi:hypothetical protein